MDGIPRIYVAQGSGNNIKPLLVVNLGLECEVKYLSVLAVETRELEFLAINPLGELLDGVDIVCKAAA